MITIPERKTITLNLHKKPCLFDDEVVFVYELQSGSAFAFNHLYKNYSSALMLEIMAIVRTPQQGEDVLQETFIKISRCLDQFDPKRGKLFTWMARIAKNSAVDSLRSKTERHARLAEDMEHCESILEERYQYHYVPDHMDIIFFVNRLPIHESELIRIIYFKGLSHTEAADFLGIPLGTVKSRWRHAMISLRKIFAVNAF